MADKIFSDSSRYAVKNPLLSSAVTGVSIEDLTQHAVLLPVVRANVQDSNPHTPSHTAETVTSRPLSFGTTFSKPIDDSPPSKPETESRDAQPKNDPKKTHDDFDVNEYFARLQGMKYVSAPLNSNLDGDKLKSEAVLESESEDVDSNFSEINLRDDSQNNSDFPQDSGQSLTADLAQNFSQLPQVLPQVASAVFSSFSNILNRNILSSRVEESEALKPVDYSGHSYSTASSNMIGSGDFISMSESDGSLSTVQVNPVPMFNAGEYNNPSTNVSQNPIPKFDMLKPPEIGSANNFRLGSKKKHYAQIPGLRSGEIVDTSQMHSPQNIQHAGMPPKPPSIPCSNPLVPMVPTESQSQNQKNYNLSPMPYIDPPPVPYIDPLNPKVLTESQSEKRVHLLNQATCDLSPMSADHIRPPTVSHSKPYDTSVPKETSPIFIPNQFNMSQNIPNQESYVLPNSSTSASSIFHNVPFTATKENVESNIANFPSGRALPKPAENESCLMVLEQPKSDESMIQNPLNSIRLSESSHNIQSTPIPVSLFVPEPVANNLNPVLESDVLPELEPPSFYNLLVKSNPAATVNVPYMAPENSNNLQKIELDNNLTMTTTSDTHNTVSSSSSFITNTEISTVDNTDISSIKSSSSALENPNLVTNVPIFFDPQSMVNKEAIKLPKNTEVPSTQNNIFRLQNKKRPQYYSGPIVDKTGPLLDNLIPEMVKRDSKSPFIPPPDLQDPTFFTAEKAIFKPEFPESTFTNSSSPSVFDLNTQYVQADYNSLASDVNQSQTMDRNDSRAQDTGSSDVFGSFKSKFSAIKLDRIQSAVTTFFDPSFYDKEKKENSSKNIDYQHDNVASDYQFQISSFDKTNQDVYNSVSLQPSGDTFQGIEKPYIQEYNHPTLATKTQQNISVYDPCTPQTVDVQTTNVSSHYYDQGNNFSHNMQNVSFYNPTQYPNVQTETQQTEFSIDNSASVQNISFYNPIKYSGENNTVQNLPSEVQQTSLYGEEGTTIGTNSVSQESRVSHDTNKSLYIQPEPSNNSYSGALYNPLNYANTQLGSQDNYTETQKSQFSNNTSESLQNMSFYNPMDFSREKPLGPDLLPSTQTITDSKHEIIKDNAFNDIDGLKLSEGLDEKQSSNVQLKQTDNSYFANFYNPSNYSDIKANVPYIDNQIKSSETKQSDSSANVFFYNPMEYSDATSSNFDLSSNTKTIGQQFDDVQSTHADTLYSSEFYNPLNYGVVSTGQSATENIPLYNPLDYSEIKNVEPDLKNQYADTLHVVASSKDTSIHNPLDYYEKNAEETRGNCFRSQETKNDLHLEQSQSNIASSIPLYNPFQFLERIEDKSFNMPMQSEETSQSNILTNVPQRASSNNPSLDLVQEPIKTEENLDPPHDNEQMFDLQENKFESIDMAENVTVYNPLLYNQEALNIEPKLRHEFDSQKSEYVKLCDVSKNIENQNTTEFDLKKSQNLENPSEHCQILNAENTETSVSDYKHSIHSFAAQNTDIFKTPVEKYFTELEDEVPSDSASEIRNKLRNMSFCDPQTLCQNLSELLPVVDVEDTPMISMTNTLLTENTMENIKKGKDNPIHLFESNIPESFTVKDQSSFNIEPHNFPTEINSTTSITTQEHTSSDFTEVTNDYIDQLEKGTVDEDGEIGDIQNLDSNAQNTNEKHPSNINETDLQTDVTKVECLPGIPQQQYYAEINTNMNRAETKMLEIDTSFSNDFSSDIIKTKIDYEAKIENKDGAEFSERPLHLDLPTNASDEVKAGFNQAMSPEDIEELSTQLSLTNMKEENLRDYEIPPTAPPAEEFDHLESELKNLDKTLANSSNEKDEISSTTDDYKLGNVNEMDSNNAMKMSDTEIIVRTTPISFASYFDTGNFAVENHYKNSQMSPLKQELIMPLSEPIPPSISDPVKPSNVELNTMLQADPLQFFSSSPPIASKAENNENNWLSNYFGSTQTSNENDSFKVSHEKQQSLASESSSNQTDSFFHLGQDQNFFPDTAKSQPKDQFDLSSNLQIAENQTILSDFHFTEDHNYFTLQTSVPNILGPLSDESFQLTEDHKPVKESDFTQLVDQPVVLQFPSNIQNKQPNFPFSKTPIPSSSSVSSFNLVKQNNECDNLVFNYQNDPKGQQKDSFFHLTKDHNFFKEPSETIENISNTPSNHWEPRNYVSTVLLKNPSSIDSDNLLLYQNHDSNYYSQPNSSILQATSDTEKSLLSLDHCYFTESNSTENEMCIPAVNKLPPTKSSEPNEGVILLNQYDSNTSNFFDVSRLKYDRHKTNTFQNNKYNTVPSTTITPDMNLFTVDIAKTNSSVDLRGENECSSFDVGIQSSNIECQNNVYKPFSNSLFNSDLPTDVNNIDAAISKDDIKEVSEDHFLKILKDCSDCRGLIEDYIVQNLEAGFLGNFSEDNMDAEGGNSDKTDIQKNASDESKEASQDDTMRKSSKSASVTFEELGESQEEQTFVAEEEKPQYKPVTHHWFHRIDQDSKSIWRPFSLTDSEALEEAYNSPTLNEDTVVATDGGRYDVNIMERKRSPIYWSDKPTNVRRCSWFYKGTTDARYVPYPEHIAERLEEEYRHGMTRREWHRRVELPGGESVVLHGPSIMVHFLQQSSPDAWGNTPNFVYQRQVQRGMLGFVLPPGEPRQIDHLLLLLHGVGEYFASKMKQRMQTVTRPRVVKRGLDEFDIDNGESSTIDHLLLLVHGIGSVCDLRFRSVEEVVDEFRAISLQLVQSHYKEACEQGKAGRIEVLPVSWHSTLHSPETGIDKLINLITLDSIPKLRNFTNDTLLDVLFYTSPVFCQTIMDTVGAELNRICKLFQKRNPSFQGGIALGGHSLGSLIIFDLLCHQRPDLDPTSVDMSEQVLTTISPDNAASASSQTAVSERRKSNVSYVVGSAGTGQPFITYPALSFKPSAFFALGSPIGMFECVRGIDALGEDFELPTCPAFFNIFHPYDPVAYRIEPLINAELKDLPPLLIPHHKGRKRMHLELKDTVLRVGTDLKQRLVESIRSTWASVWRAPDPPAPDQLQKVVQDQLDKEGQVALDEKGEEEKTEEAEKPSSEEDTSYSSENTSRLLTKLGRLNGGRRVDHVLQEAPFEMINEYIFAMTSHVCYWESEDTMLLILREIYSSLGVTPDRGVPQQSLRLEVERPSSSNGGRIVTKISSQSDSNIHFVRDQNRQSENLSPPIGKQKPELSKSQGSSETRQ